MHKKRRVLIVDGYNVLNAWRQNMSSIDDARDELTARLQNYADYTAQQVIVVYDAWLSDRKTRSMERVGNLEVVFTQKGETADQYIERLADGYRREIELDRLELRVATSDLVEQTVVLGRGAIRVSAREVLAEISLALHQGKTQTPVRKNTRTTVADSLPPAVRDKLERMRRGG